MTRAQKALFFSRLCLAVLAMTIGVLVLGPFQGAEEAFGLTDKEAHAIAFFALTLMLQVAMPRVRRLDIALGVLAVGALIEVLQLFTGRSASVSDWLADFVGVAFATAPSFVETARGFLRGESRPQRRAGDRRDPLKAGRSA
ncbi:VanZ family protein [Asticcacaulis sp.]|uniref:VanZ family protein n=1 Tax=Asticcacaulis sp. TaxID=1872648 RepID=UPI00391A9BC6